MSAARLLTACALHGIRLEAEGSRLRYHAAEGVLTPELRERIKTHKSKPLTFLNKEAANTMFDPGSRCPTCGGSQWWQLSGGSWHCRTCSPDMALSATTLTLPHGTVGKAPVPNHPQPRIFSETADTAADARRQAVLAMLAQEPGLHYAMASDNESEPDVVLVTLAIRGKATCELKIPKDRYDGLALLQVLEEHTGGSYAKT